MSTPAPLQLTWLASCGLVAILLQGCAGGASHGGPPDTAAVVRGETLAEHACGQCHAVGASGPSPFPGAPAFRDMRMDYNAISYQRRLAQLHAGRIGMPPAQVSLAELADLIAYAQSLKSIGDRYPPPPMSRNVANPRLETCSR